MSVRRSTYRNTRILALSYDDHRLLSEQYNRKRQPVMIYRGKAMSVLCKIFRWCSTRLIQTTVGRLTKANFVR